MIQKLIELNEKFKSIRFNAEVQPKLAEEKIKELNKKLHVEKDEINEIITKLEHFIKHRFPDSTTSDTENTTSRVEEINRVLINEGLLKEVEVDIYEDEPENDNIVKLFEERVYIQNQKNYLISNSVVNLISEFENYIAEYLKNYFEKNTNRIVENKAIGITELKRFNSMKDAYEHLINQEIMGIMYGSIDKWVGVISKMNNSKVPYYEKNKIYIAEIFARRNLIMHNNSIVNTTYINVSSNPYNYVTNGKIDTDFNYISQSLDHLIVMATIIFINFWRSSKNSKDVIINKKTDLDNEAITTLVQSIAFQLLSEEKWNLALTIYEELLTCSKVNGINKEMFNLNIMLCKKMLSDSNIEKTINDYDYSAFDDFLKMGGAALKEDKTNFLEIIKNMPLENRLTQNQYRKWPIFIKLREDKEFSEKVIQICKDRQSEKKVKKHILDIEKIKSLVSNDKNDIIDLEKEGN